MLEWLEVRLDVVHDKRLVYKCRIEALNSDGDALNQECCPARIADSGTQPRTHLSEKTRQPVGTYRYMERATTVV